MILFCFLSSFYRFLVHFFLFPGSRGAVRRTPPERVWLEDCSVFPPPSGSVNRWGLSARRLLFFSTICSQIWSPKSRFLVCWCWCFVRLSRWPLWRGHVPPPLFLEDYSVFSMWGIGKEVKSNAIHDVNTVDKSDVSSWLLSPSYWVLWDSAPSPVSRGRGNAPPRNAFGSRIIVFSRLPAAQ